VTASQPPLMTARDLTVRLGGTTVVDGVTLALHPGEIVALVGPNGAGKTTLMRALAGLVPAAGDIRLDDRTLSALPPRERARRIAYLPQGHVFHWPLPAAAVVALGRHPHADPFVPPSAADRAAVAHALAATDTAALAHRRVTTLSGGERARVALARALATGPQLLLADEPTAALDPRHQLTVMELLAAMAREGRTVLAILHDLTLAARCCSRVIVMDRGRIAGDAPPAEALAPARLAAVFGITAVAIEIGGCPVPFALRPATPDSVPAERGPS
jgi:iron complex transport system ATP-binding protein